MQKYNIARIKPYILLLLPVDYDISPLVIVKFEMLTIESGEIS